MTAQKKVIVIAGPTGVGKTALAIAVAKRFNTAIISADSRQCYKELKIGVARPSENELQQVEHHFIGTHSIQEEVTAAVFEEYALKKAGELFRQHDIIVMAGGTGLYIQAFCEGLDAIPPTDAVTRERIINAYEKKGLPWLQQEIQQKDEAFYRLGEIKNPQRLMRALEVMESTGKSILSFRNKEKKTRDFEIIKIGLTIPKEQLSRHIDVRVEEMVKNGLLEEVRSLQPCRELKALQTVGYTEVFSYLDGITPLEKAIEKIKTNTRHYAKRQMTWFNKDTGLTWFPPSGLSEIIDWVNKG
jgi:tRNA dimethylallyltransferase